MRAVVTIKLPRNPKHNPRNKKEGVCPVTEINGIYTWCTDVTGSHHSFLLTGENKEEILKMLNRYHHITRVEYFAET